MSVFKKKWQFVLFQFFRYLCFTGIIGNLAETPILKDIFIFLAVIKSCRANFGVKWRMFFSTSIFVQKCQFWGKKIEFREKCWFFQTIVHYYWKWTSYWKTCLFSENCDFLCDCLYTSRKCRILIKTSIFLRKFLFVHVLLFIKVFYLWKIVILIQNIISFGDILDKSVISW